MLYMLRNDIVCFLRARVALFWTLAFPVMLLAIQMALFGGSGRLPTASVAFVGHLPSKSSSRYVMLLKSALAVQTDVLVHFVPSSSTADVDVVIPQDFPERPEAGHTAKVELHLNRDTPSARALQGIIVGATQYFDLVASGSPALATAVPKNPAPSQRRYALYLATGVAVMTLLSSALMGFAVPLVQARDGGLLRLYGLFPMRRESVLAATALSRLAICVAASAILLVASAFAYGLGVSPSLPGIAWAAVLVVVGTASFLCVGLLVASLSPSVTAATIICNVIYFPLVFTGNLFIPLNGLPAGVQEIIDWLPVNALAASLRRSLSGELNPMTEATTMAILAVLGFAAFVAASRGRFLGAA